MENDFQNICDTVYVSNSDLLETIIQVDGFYNNIWTTTAWIVAFVMGIIGVAIPIFLTWLQSQRHNKDKEEFNHLRINYNTLKTQVDNNIKELNTTFIEYNKEIEKLKNQKQEIMQEIADFQISFFIDKIAPKHHFKENSIATEDFLHNIESLQEYKSSKTSAKVFEILDNITNAFLEEMTPKIAHSTHNIATSYFPLLHIPKEQQLEIGKRCADVGFSLVLDAFVKAKKLSIIPKWGLLILKHAYRQGKTLNLPELQKYVKEKYKELKNSLEKGEMQNIEHIKEMQELIQISEKDLETPHKVFPELPENLDELTKE